MFFKHALVDGGKKLVVFCGMWVVEHPDVVEAIVVRA